ncbi:MAG TPA: L-histidine N(alpha)-methyltransferase [Gemmatimonadaceae bacterium]|nr:L-histidine N(alpha)-methyltransferase [Gemmatimonadaceae bacterium]
MTSAHVDPALNALDAAERRTRLMFADVRDGLARRPRELPPKYFYDERGSHLFEEITRLPEYYLTRAEREILLARTSGIVDAMAPRTLVELGAGSAAKTRVLLAAMQTRVPDVTYVPVDVSEEFLQQTRDALRRESPTLHVEPVVADIEESLDLPPMLDEPILFAFLGSTIGNFAPRQATALLRRIRAHMRPRDRFLMGTDLRKDRATLEAAYNDAAGVTAEFNRNMLRVLNAELGADFETEQFVHRAIYNDIEHRIEMYLHSAGQQTVHIPGLDPIAFADGEAIRTELSHKYDRAAVDALAATACLRVAEWFTDSEGRFALSLLEPRL